MKVLKGERSIPYCEPCKIWHVVPRDRTHHTALGCRDRYRSPSWRRKHKPEPRSPEQEKAGDLFVRAHDVLTKLYMTGDWKRLAAVSRATIKACGGWSMKKRLPIFLAFCLGFFLAREGSSRGMRRIPQWDDFTYVAVDHSHDPPQPTVATPLGGVTPICSVTFQPGWDDHGSGVGPFKCDAFTCTPDRIYTYDMQTKAWTTWMPASVADSFLVLATGESSDPEFSVTVKGERRCVVFWRENGKQGWQHRDWTWPEVLGAGNK